jgi:RNase H-like domain found in reverse transcriptase
MTAAVAAAKDALAAATGLAHPLPHAQLALVTDAPDSHVGGVLKQREVAAWRPLSFFSQKLTPAQRRYSTFDRELTAVFSALRHFRFGRVGSSAEGCSCCARDFCTCCPAFRYLCAYTHSR